MYRPVLRHFSFCLLGVLPDASVTVFCLDRAFGTETNGDGAFEFAELPPGTYSVWVTRESFVSQTIETVQIVDGQTRQIAITLKIASTSCFPEASTSYEKRSDDVNLAGKVSGSCDGPLKEQPSSSLYPDAVRTEPRHDHAPRRHVPSSAGLSLVDISYRQHIGVIRERLSPNSGLPVKTLLVSP